MKLLLQLFTICFIAALSSPVFAQQSAGKLDGKILDAKNNPVPYATITLLGQDSSVVNGDLTKEDGSFHIEPTGFGNFLLRINIIGFDERYIGNIRVTSANPEKNLGKITISSNAQRLDEVQVVGEKAMMEMHVDKKVFNVEKILQLQEAAQQMYFKTFLLSLLILMEM